MVKRVAQAVERRVDRGVEQFHWRSQLVLLFFAMTPREGLSRASRRMDGVPAVPRLIKVGPATALIGKIVPRAEVLIAPEFGADKGRRE